MLPGYGNPAASLKVKSYHSAVKEEQLLVRTIPTQAEPFFIQDLAAISTETFRRLSGTISSPVQLFLWARDQAFFKTLFLLVIELEILEELKPKRCYISRRRRASSSIIF